MKQWERASSYKIKFDPIWKIKKPGPFYKFYGKQNKDYIYLWYIDKLDTSNINSDLVKKMKTADSFSLENLWGLVDNFYDKKHTNVIIFNENNENKYFTAVVLHELGHLIGLRHIEKRNTIMNPNVDYIPNCITYEDSLKLCEIYSCDPISLCN